MKNKFHFVLLSFKNNILPTLFVAFTICLVVFSNENLTATKKGLFLWANSVVPALLPFFIATELLSHTKVVSFIGKLLNKYMRPIFNVPGIGAYAFVMGIISGYPVGAKIVTQFRNDGLCTKAEAERLLAFTNNSGPLFIIGTVGISMFGNTMIGFLLFFTHFFSCIIVAFLFKFWKFSDKEIVSNSYFSDSTKSSVHFSNLGEVLSNSITSSINTIIMIGGFVILFSVIISILNTSGLLVVLSKLIYPIFKLIGLDFNYITPIISGIIELTNGLNIITSIATKNISTIITICAFLLGFGGISIMLQVLSITSKSDISIKPYIIGKALQGIIAAILTYACIHLFPIFNLDIAPIFSETANSINKVNAFTNPYNVIIFILIVVFTALTFFKRRCIKQ